jgi:hypothetical protein
MNNTIVIIGGGASVKAFIPRIWDDLKGLPVLSVNHAYRFLKEPPRWQVSADRKFWKNAAPDMDRLAAAGSVMVNRENELAVSRAWKEGEYFAGGRKLSGVFALDWALKSLAPERVFLFGYDFGPIDGKTHFYDEPLHSGVGKERAYIGPDGLPFPAVNDFERFKGRGAEIYVIGPTNITAFHVLTYGGFLDRIGRA